MSAGNVENVENKNQPNKEMSKESVDLQEVLREITEISDNLQKAEQQFYRQLKPAVDRVKEALNRPLFGRILLYLALEGNEDLEQALEKLMKNDTAFNWSLVEEVRLLSTKVAEFDEKVETLGKRIKSLEQTLIDFEEEGLAHELEKFKKVLDEHKKKVSNITESLHSSMNLVVKALESVSKELEEVNKTANDNVQNLSKTILKLQESMKVKVKTRDGVKELDVPTLLREMLYQLTGAVEERKRLIEATEKLSEIEKHLAALTPLVYQDIPEIPKRQTLIFISLLGVGLISILALLLDFLVLFKLH